VKSSRGDRDRQSGKSSNVRQSSCFSLFLFCVRLGSVANTNEEFLCFEELNVLLGGLKALSVA
jgi:hypothetical protein